MRRQHAFQLRTLVLAIAACTLHMGAHSQAVAASASSDTAVIPGEQMSAWLVRNAPAGTDLTALHWRVDTERGPQGRLRSAALEGLGNLPVAQWLAQLPLTGRLSLAHNDARWMQANAPSDPVLGGGDSVLLLKRPTQVAVLRENAQVCLVPHLPGAMAADYLAACLSGETVSKSDKAFESAVDWAWLVQPDGRVSRQGVQPWNAEAQDEPAPGAWLWAPAQKSNISVATSGNLARFLATQLPAEVLGQGATGISIPAPTAASAPPRSLELTASDWGEIGLLQTPTARMERAGEIRTHISGVWPYTRGNVLLQPLNWLELGFRYTDIQYYLYGPSIAGTQTYKDKSFDFKVRLWEEGPGMPQLALGMRDIGGTGLFSSEYLVANKRWGNWDASLGVAWGDMGARGDIKAPLGLLGESFNKRAAQDFGQGGTVGGGGMFHGDAGLFGGVQWRSPVDGLILKAELDGNDYQHEPFGETLPAPSPFNFGAVYRYSPYVDLSAGWERGDRVSFGVTLHQALDRMDSPKVLDAPLPRPKPLPPVAQLTMAPSELSPQGWSDLSKALGEYAGWQVTEMDQQGNVLTVRAETDLAVFTAERVERAITVLHAMLPPTIRHLVLQLWERGIALSSLQVDRAEWAAQHTQAVAPSQKLPAVQLFSGHAQLASASEAPVYQKPLDTGFNMELGPSYSHILGGPDGFLLYQLGLRASFEKHFTRNTWLSGAVNARILDNFDNFKFTGGSDLPRVRTYQREFVTTSKVTIPSLSMKHVEDLGGGHYAGIYGGMLESMYGGYGAEWLYRPWKSRIAFGVDVNHVRQRDFKQDFTFREYEVDTGHATLYWDTGWNDVQLNLSAGRYLAGDVGATVDISRVFPNGTAIGAWATKTNVSAEQFGEGSFDKGVYISMPLDVVLPKTSPGVYNVEWRPLTRDGGAKLARGLSLFGLTSQRAARTWTQSSKPPKDSDKFQSALDNSYIERNPSGGFWNYAGSATGGVARGIASISGSAWLWGGAAVLGASLLDNELDNWAKDHQGGNWDRLGNLANNIPVALALGSGLMFTGLAGDDAAAAAQTSLTAGALTMGTNLLTKYAVGRSRPADELGNAHFNSFGSGATQSSFTSNHVSLAFALATPFAKQYDNPWLYGLASTTVLGRIQSREHWLSDTVAAGMMGYAIGTITYEQQHGSKRNVRLSATPQSVNASWSF